MCDIEFDGYVDVWEERERRARKAHRCDCCYRQIVPGQRYVSHFSVYDGERNYEKICLECDADRQEFAGEHAVRLSPAYWADFLLDCISDGDEEDRTRWIPLRDRHRARCNEAKLSRQQNNAV